MRLHGPCFETERIALPHHQDSAWLFIFALAKVLCRTRRAQTKRCPNFLVGNGHVLPDLLTPVVWQMPQVVLFRSSTSDRSRTCERLPRRGNAKIRLSFDGWVLFQWSPDPAYGRLQINKTLVPRFQIAFRFGGLDRRQ